MNTTNYQSWFLGHMNKILSNNRQYFYRITDQSDKIIVWLVGFSITSIALSIHKESELNLFIENLTGYVLIFGSLTVICGILYRIFLYLAQVFEINILIAFEGYIEGYNNPPNIQIGRILKDENSYQDIISFIKEDFEIEIEEIDISVLDAAQIEVLRQSVVDYYLSLNNWSNKKLERETNEVKEVLSNFLGYSNKKIERIFNPKTEKVKFTSLFWFSYYAASILFIISCLAFTTGMIVILVEYLIKISC